MHRMVLVSVKEINITTNSPRWERKEEEFKKKWKADFFERYKLIN